ncbi:MAG TPA: glycosyltransferase 87 family protein [Solirubrobacteraceae bacterium]|jgi:hypothetical protein|nr:glycosyltransferase 87 family protein [Solirubrobacteraceae bacterium]
MSGERRFRLCLATAAIAYAVAMTYRSINGWDYGTDAGPALAALAHGSLPGFFAHQPAMGAFSLYLRAPFVLVAQALHGDLYRAGSLPCVLSVALVALGLARRAAARGTGRLGQTLLVAACLLNPLIGDALYWGHPEELLAASLSVGALLAADEQNGLWCAVLAGLAVATKQWAVIVVVPCLLILRGGRLRATGVMAATAALATLPMLIGSASAFMHAAHYISRPQPIVTVFTWLYPFSPHGVVHVSNLFGDSRTFIGHQLLGVEASLSRVVIVAVAVGLPLLCWWRDRRLSAGAVLRVTAIACVLRCALDPGSMGYYHLPLLLVLAAIDASAGRRIPVASIAGAFAAFICLERAPAYLDPPVTNALYLAASLTAVVLLVRSLRALRAVPVPLPTPRALAPGDRLIAT